MTLTMYGIRLLGYLARCASWALVMIGRNRRGSPAQKLNSTRFGSMSNSPSSSGGYSELPLDMPLPRWAPAAQEIQQWKLRLLALGAGNSGTGKKRNWR